MLDSIWIKKWIAVVAQGLKSTIACMDEEHPRTEASINNRSHLRQVLNLEDLYRKNKVGDKGLYVMHIIEKVNTCVADLNIIAGSELSLEIVAGDNCKVSHHKRQGWQHQQ